jgi:hypothetical protein
MSLSDKFNNSIERIQEGTKHSFYTIFLLSVKIISSFFFGLLISLIFKELSHFGNLLFLFTLLVFTAVFFKLITNLSLRNLIIVDSFIVLICLLLKMYIMIAPN